MADCSIAHKYWIVDVVLMVFFPPQNVLQGGGETICKETIFLPIHSMCKYTQTLSLSLELLEVCSPNTLVGSTMLGKLFCLFNRGYYC